ncbi:ricin-type beta-trefoil lectin domain protein [Longimycelium tulufanense]|nr:ricin-type beta-trefoil lectin domain protein [Longimycelium tulufanense]
MTTVGLLSATPAHAVGGGTPAQDGELPFVAKVDVDGRSCSGVLVDPEWVATAGPCFPEEGVGKATVTVGRSDLRGRDGQQVTIVDIVKREDRALVLARLARAVLGVAPVPVATAAPKSGEVLRVAGFGRTAEEWVPDKAHVASFRVQKVTSTRVDVVGAEDKAAICKGDAGGPLFREAGGRLELVGLNHTSWQKGCLEETETRDGAREVRMDTVADWVGQQIPRVTIRNSNGLCWDIGSNEPATPVVMIKCQFGNGSQYWWTLHADGTVRNTNGLCAEATTKNTVITQTCKPGNAGQRWAWASDGSLRNKAQELCADIVSNEPGTPVGVARCVFGNPSQRWSALSDTMIRNTNGLCMDLNTNNRGEIVLTANCQPTNPSQRWAFGADRTIRNFNGLCMDLSSNAAGTKVGMNTCQPTNPSQHWELTPDRTIRNSNGLCMDISSNKPSTNVIMVRCQPNNPSQHWTQQR